MGLARSFCWMNKNDCKKQCRSLIWRIRAAVKKSMKSNHHSKSKKQVRFHYDPSSYALNFDDGGHNNFCIDGGLRREAKSIDEENDTGYYYKLQFFFSLAANSTLVYVFLIRI
ncbi:UDP-glycosyltransferase 72E2 [Bienertia sinuspersici]